MNERIDQSVTEAKEECRQFMIAQSKLIEGDHPEEVKCFGLLMELFGEFSKKMIESKHLDFRDLLG